MLCQLGRARVCSHIAAIPRDDEVGSRKVVAAASAETLDSPLLHQHACTASSRCQALRGAVPWKTGQAGGSGRTPLEAAASRYLASRLSVPGKGGATASPVQHKSRDRLCRGGEDSEPDSLDDFGSVVSPTTMRRLRNPLWTHQYGPNKSFGTKCCHAPAMGRHAADMRRYRDASLCSLLVLWPA